MVLGLSLSNQTALRSDCLHEISDFLNNIYKQLTNSQVATAMDIMSGLQSDLGSNGAALALQNVMSVLQQAIVPYAQQVIDA